MKKLLFLNLLFLWLLSFGLMAQSCPSDADAVAEGPGPLQITITFDMSVDVNDINTIIIDGIPLLIADQDDIANTITIDYSALNPTEAFDLFLAVFDAEDFTVTLSGSSTNLSCEYEGGNLPVELTSFQASLQGKDIALAWTTASEVNNEMFQVERSGDGQSFSAIGVIAGAGTTQETQAYAFMDKFPLPGLNYYRLKQMDFDGQFEYSDIVSAWVESSSLRIYPNPTKGQVKIALPDAEANGTYQIFNPAGQVLLQGAIQEDIIDLSNINKGLYFLQINTNGRIETQKIQKQ